MARDGLYPFDKKTMYKWAFYLNIVLFIIVALFVYLLIRDSYQYGLARSDEWLLVARDIAFLAVALALIFFQFFRNLLIIMRRSW